MQVKICHIWTSGLEANVNVQKFRSLFGELTSLRSKAAYSASISSAWGSVEKTIWDSRLSASSLWCCLSAQSHGVSLFSFSANRSPPRFTRNCRGVREGKTINKQFICSLLKWVFIELWKHTVNLMHEHQHEREREKERESEVSLYSIRQQRQ